MDVPGSYEAHIPVNSERSTNLEVTKTLRMDKEKNRTIPRKHRVPIVPWDLISNEEV
jgi:hypothetical protein